MIYCPPICVEYGFKWWPFSLHAAPFTHLSILLKGIVRVCEVGSYKVHIYSRSVPYRNCRSAQPQFGEAESRSSPDAQLCTAVNGVQMQSEFNHPKQGPTKKICISSSVCRIEKIHTTLHRRQIALSCNWHYIFSTVEPPYPYALAQLGLALYLVARRSPVWVRM